MNGKPPTSLPVDPVHDYLNHPPQRWRLECGVLIADGEGDLVKFAEMDLYMFEGGQLMLRMLAENTALREQLAAQLQWRKDNSND